MTDRGRQGDREFVARLSEPVPLGDRSEPLLLWDAGEQGLAVETLADLLCDAHVPLGRADRARLAEMAKSWNVLGRVAGALRWCPDADDPDPRWRVVEGTDREPVVAAELGAETGPGHVLHGRELVVWLACNACDDVLVRLDESRARARGRPHRFAVAHPTWSGQRESPLWPMVTVYASSLAALDRLERCSA
ncbi:hypothetical protein LUW76_25390 [Actinomadura madurae]|uniref:hypothetical protein n=1 Tax=Actinomadura madurae TaxID=1993 RepID=UPI002025FF3E|nr:hypothetical protein [Actinomadura madurae]URM97419.1 hypothetical protein LUW76_25390 [Actinomadura madurae]